MSENLLPEVPEAERMHAMCANKAAIDCQWLDDKPCLSCSHWKESGESVRARAEAALAAVTRERDEARKELATVRRVVVVRKKTPYGSREGDMALMGDV